MEYFWSWLIYNKVHLLFKDAWSNFSQQSFLFKCSIINHQRNLGFNFQLNRSNGLDMWGDLLELLIPCCVSLIMVTITSHTFVNIFQTVHFSSVKFTRGNEKNMGFLLIPKSLKLWENLRQSDRAPLRQL